ncbi:myosin-VIIa-like [Crassostrea virginica]
MAAAVNGSKAGKHVSQIAVGGPAPPKKQSLPSASAFGGDERHFNLAVINGEDTEVKKPVNGGHIEQELGPEFGKATLSKSAPVADVVRERLTSEIQPPNLDELSNGNGNHEASAPSSDSTTSDEKSSQSSLQEVSEPGTATSWTLFAQSYFQVKGSHTYLCSALQQPLLPKKDKADILASLASWVSILRIMGDLPESDHGENLDVAGSTPPIISQVKQSFHHKYTKRDVDEAYKKYSELFKDPSHSDIQNIPFLSEKVSSVLEKVQYVCALGIYKPELRDEIFCQVCKQLTNNPSRNSSVRGWVLLHLLAGCFTPTEKFFSCFLHFLRESSPIFSSRVERLVRRTAIIGTRGYPPSWLEFQASKNCKPILIPMSMMNGQRMIVEADSASTVQELTHQICHKAGLRDASGFSIYITLTQRISCLGNGTHRVMDAVAECEQHTKQSGMRESSSTWRLYFRKEYFLPWQNPIDDPVATDLIYQQIMRGVSVGEYKSKKDEEIIKLAAQRYFVENPGPVDTTKLQTFLTGWLPESNKKTVDLSYWTPKVLEVLQNDITKDRNKVREVKCDVVKFAKDKWHAVFSRFYDAQKIQSPAITWQNVILGLNNKGLEILDEKEDVKSSIFFHEITDVSKGRHSVTVSTLRSEDFVVTSNHADDLYLLLNKFMDGLRRKSKYGIAVQDSTQLEGAIGVGLTKGDLVELEQPYEQFMNEDVYSATCVKTGKLNMMPRDLIYVIPTVEEPAHDTLGMLTVQIRKDPSVFPTHQCVPREHTLQMYAKLHFRQSNDNAVSKFLSKASFKSSKKDKSHSIWQYQREPIKKPLLRRTHLREELRRASCRSFLAIQQYMGISALPDQMSEMELSNEFVIEPAMRSRHMRDEIYCQIIKQLTNNPNKPEEEKGWQLLYLLCTCAVPSTELFEECEQFLRGSKHPMSQKCLTRIHLTKSDGARQYPPHPMEHVAMANKKHTISVTIGFPFQHQQDFEVEVSCRVAEIKRTVVDTFDLDGLNEYGLCFGLKDRVISATDGDFFLDSLTNVELFWAKQTRSHRSSVTESNSGSSGFTAPSTVHVFFLKKLWVNSEPGKNKNADSMFHFPQEVPNYLRGYHNCSEKDAGRLAAYIYRAQFADDMSALADFESNVKALIPQPLLEKKPTHEWKQVVKEELVKTKGTNSDNAKLAFLKIIHQWPTYGSVFFTVKQRSMKSYPKSVLFAVNVHGVMFLDVTSKNILAKYDYSQIPNWAFDEQSFTLVVGEGPNSTKIYMETNLGHNMDDIVMSYVAWMMNTHIQKRPSYAGVTLDDAIQDKDGLKAGDLLSFEHPHVANPRLQIERPEPSVQRVFDTPLDELVAAHIRCCWAVSNHDFIEAYGCQAVAVQAFTKLFQSQKDENWSLPIMFAVCLDLRLFANSADAQAQRRGKGKVGERLEKAAELLMGCFRVCASDNRASVEDTKKWGMLNLVNQLFKIYFKINKLHLCKPLIRAIDSLPLKDRFPLAQQVTFRYYVGRKAMFDSDFKSADEFLTFAFTRCHKSSTKNKRMTLIYLLPVKMLLGYMPSQRVLQKYDLLQFAEVAQAVSSGNLLSLNKALEKNEAFFIKCGIYLILEKLKIITYRNLFKKVHLILGTHQLPIESFTTALRMMKVEDIDNDETACLIANLIYENKIKGYISHQHQKLVVSKQNAFPKLSTVL